jgi:hypothetical protein
MSILATMIHWYGAVRDAWCARIYGAPAPTLTADLLYVSVEPIPLEKCQGPESTPGSYQWVSTHAFFATETGLMCPDCGLAWPEEVRS